MINRISLNLSSILPKMIAIDKIKYYLATLSLLFSIKVSGLFIHITCLSMLKILFISSFLCNA